MLYSPGQWASLERDDNNNRNTPNKPADVAAIIVIIIVAAARVMRRAAGRIRRLHLECSFHASAQTPQFIIQLADGPITTPIN
jgi:hypothetical protein